MVSEKILKFFPIKSLAMSAIEEEICCHHPWQPVPIQSAQKPYVVFPSTWWCITWNLITFGQLTLEPYVFENVNGQPMDGLMDKGRKTIAMLIPHYEPLA